MFLNQGLETSTLFAAFIKRSKMAGFQFLASIVPPFYLLLYPSLKANSTVL